MKFNYQIIAVFFGLLLTTGCVSTFSDEGGESENRDILANLTQQQKMTLLAMLESYDSHQQAIETWQASEASVARLVELESDLKLLIMQLNSLNEDPQQPPAAAEEPQNNTESRVSANSNEMNSGQSVNRTSVTNNREATSSQETTNSQKFSSPPLLQGFTIQLTAVNSMKHLRAYRRQVQQLNPVLFAEATPFFEEVSLVNGSRMFRLKVGKFNTKTAAMGVCREFVLSGGSCFATDNIKGQLLSL